MQNLSDAARRVLEAGRGSAYTRLVVQGDGGDAGLRKQLAALSPDNVLSRPVVSREDAHAVIAGLWLWHDFLEESHTISQDVATPTGSFWHAIMHRREGDFSNSKYWYARCLNHPVIGQLAYDPNSFVDEVARASRLVSGDAVDAAVNMQRLEWEALFKYCVQNATASR